MNEVQVTIKALAVQINAAHDACLNDAASAVQHAAQAGQLLIDAKKQVVHGGWLPWIEANCRFSRMTASRYMRVAANVTRVLHLEDPDSMRQALAILAVPGPGDGEEEATDPVANEPTKEETKSSRNGRSSAHGAATRSAEKKEKAMKKSQTESPSETMEEDETETPGETEAPSLAKAPPLLREAVLDVMFDGQARTIPQLISAVKASSGLDISVQQVRTVFVNLRRRPIPGKDFMVKKIGDGVCQYRLVDSSVNDPYIAAQKLIDELKAMGKWHEAKVGPGLVALIAHELQRAFDAIMEARDGSPAAEKRPQKVRQTPCANGRKV